MKDNNYKTALNGNDSHKTKSKSKKSRSKTSVKSKSRNDIEASMLSVNNVSIQGNQSQTGSRIGSHLNPPAKVQDKASKISIPSAVFTMFVGIVGAGCLALPYAIRKSGLVTGLFLIVTAPILSYFTLDLLVISCEYLPKHVVPSYQALTYQALGSRSKTLLEYLMLVMYFGALAGYVVAWSGLSDLVWKQVGGSKIIDSVYLIAVIGISYGVTLPLSLLRNLSALQYTSCFGAVCATYLSIVVTTNYFILCHEAQNVTHDPHYSNTCFWKEPLQQDFGNKILFPFHTSRKGFEGFLTAFPLIVFAYTGHMYILPVYVRLKRKSLPRIRTVFKAGNTFIFAVYIFIAAFGFFLFLEDVCGNLLLNNFEKKTDTIIAAIGVALSCICSSPLFTYNFRRTMAALIWNKTPETLSLIKHFLIAIVFVSANVLVGWKIKSITVVFGWLGATMYPFMGYVLPTVYFCKLVPNDKYVYRKFFAILQAVVMSVLCLSAFVWSFFEEGSDSDCDNQVVIG